LDDSTPEVSSKKKEDIEGSGSGQSS